jgi:Fur family ferric uptake transcriptional regulator
MNSLNDLKTAGLKVTLPRLRILSLFENGPIRHLSAEDIYKMLIDTDEATSLSTIYRQLAQLVYAGLLVRQHFEGGKTLFEPAGDAHHDHLLCLQCGRVEEFHDDEIEKHQIKVAKKHGFALREHSLALYVICNKSPCPHRKV